MSNIYIRLIVESFNYDSKRTYILFDDNKPLLLPRKESVESSTLVETLRLLVEEYLQIDGKWTNPALFNFEKIDNEYIATFSVMIPYEVKLKKGIRLSYEDINNPKNEVRERTLICGRPQ